MRGFSKTAHILADVLDWRGAAHFAVKPLKKNIPDDVGNAFLVHQRGIEDDVALFADLGGFADAGVEEAVMLNAEGFVSECTADNLFIIKNGELFTPPLYAGALYGITRGTVMELAEQQGIKVTETNLTRYDLFNADECFLTGTGAEIMPVIKIDGRVIGTGKPGPVSKQLIEEYHALTKVSGEPI